MEEEDRRGPGWAWELQDRLDQNVNLLLGLAGALLLGGALWLGAVASYGWLCTWWGFPGVNQAHATAAMAMAIYGLGLAAGLGISQLGRQD